ncbi:MAG: aspartate/tyrosine/aromatic aminotransferase [Paracoccaceae bacterium]|nr:aspartate/tyrosine/aromatic aminotransferase [Paracoccaceae bacterium]
MFEQLSPARPDAILALLGLFRADPREDKIDLGVGVYRNPERQTPVMTAVKAAERRILDAQTSKSYLGLAGDEEFNTVLSSLLLADALDTTRTRAIQAPGGSGAIRILAELLSEARPGATVYISDPSWPNHWPMVTASGLRPKTYPYFDTATRGIRFDAMMETLAEASAGDIVLLHGCCHNPTGANLDSGQWAAIADLIVETGLLPFIDIAYQGFGDGLDSDAAGLRTLARTVPELVVGASCSKNFGVYCDRVGLALVIGKNSGVADTAVGQLKSIARRSYSMPPNHGAATVRTVLGDSALRRQWLDELDAMRDRMLRLRANLADELRRASNSETFDFIKSHRGMFSLTGLTRSEVDRLREDHAIYMVGDGRINVAGLPDDRLDYLAESIVRVSQDS